MRDMFLLRCSDGWYGVTLITEMMMVRTISRGWSARQRPFQLDPGAPTIEHEKSRGRRAGTLHGFFQGLFENHEQWPKDCKDPSNG